ncbi:MAG TPA: 50S ribosomal protein L6 [Thermoanaerobaculia bacterium]|nr:50S ribosomal protein L6 [Thermoanaerobaculia bacterium]
MSRIGKAPITIPKGVEVKADREVVRVKGPKGELVSRIPAGISVSVADGQVRFARANDEPQQRAFHGLLRSLVANSVEGVTKGFTKDLEIVGVGYKAEVKGKSVVFSLGYSHTINFAIPDGISVALDAKAGKLTVAGADRQKVGQTAAEIRSLRVPDPYKAKGIKYANEVIRRKVGKAGGK